MAGALVIVNPESRNGATGRRWHALEPLLRSRFEAAGLGPVAVAHTRGMRDAERIAREGARDGFTRLVVAGGDGTLGEVATGLLQAGLGAATALGVLPLGRGCDFARTIGMPLDPNKAIAQLAGGGERSIDAGQVTTTVQRAAGSGSAAGDEEKDQEERFFLNEANIGVSSLVVRMVNRAGPLARRMGGTAVFAQATLRSLAAYRPARVRLRVDGEEVYDGPLIQAAIANGRYFGGGMRYAPEAEPDDGLFDLVWIRGWSKASLATKVHRLYTGTHVEHESVSSVRGRSFELDAGPDEEGRANEAAAALCLASDGESLGGLPAAVRILPRALRLFGVPGAADAGA